jgi:hypothetical protein
VTADTDREFFRELMSDVIARAGAEGRFHADAFFELVTDDLVELGEIDTADRAHHEARALRVDGYAGDPGEDGELTVIVCDFTAEDPPPTLTRRDLDAQLRRGRNFVSHALDAEWRSMINESSPGAQLATLIALSWRNVNAIRILLITNRPLSERVKTIDSDSLDGRPVTHLVWDLTRIRELRQRGSAREPIAIDLVEDFKCGIPALKVATGGELYDGYLAAINGRMLADIFRRYGARLLEQNVRVFLQARGKVNQGIRNTIQNDPDRFFAYNNGITATAGAVQTRGSGFGCEIIQIENLQIVNGGQTTSSLHAALRSLGAADNLDRISVQMKLAVLRPEDIDTMVPQISKFANSQNKVTDADFHANHPFHLTIKRHSERTLAPRADGSLQNTRWFYERARGQYADQRNKLSPSQWSSFQTQHPKAQVLTKTDVAKFDMVWRQLPHIVSAGAQKNFDLFMRNHIAIEWERDSAAFHESYFKRLVAKAIVFRHVEELVSNASWYSGGYRANIVAYTIARVARAIDDAGRVPDFDRVWEEQGVSPSLDKLLKQVAASVNSALLSPPANRRNTSEWAKLQECWSTIAKLRIEDLSGLDRVSVARADHVAGESEAKKAGRVLSGAEATIEVFARGVSGWQGLDRWARGRNILTPKEHQIVEFAASQKSLSEKQAPVALAAWDKARNAGWNGD